MEVKDERETKFPILLTIVTQRFDENLHQRKYFLKNEE